MIEIVVQNADQNRPDRSVNLHGVDMTDLMGSTAHELLAQILARYGSLDVFIARLHALLDTPTVVRPAAVVPVAGGRHRLAEPTGTVPMTTGTPPRPRG